MAINLPSGVANGTVSGNYTYDSSVPGWRKTPETASGMPAGSIQLWGGATPPANWLICNGAAVSRTTYASLFNAIGVQFGAGDGTTTFNLPDLRGRAAVGFDSTQTEFDVLGETGGAKTHTLTSAEMPSHTHTQNSHTHTGTTSTNGSHKHGIYWEGGSDSDQGYPAGGFNALMATDRRWAYDSSGYALGDAGSHNHTFTSDSTTATNQNTGGGGAHNNLQPYLVLNYIIKTSAGITSGDSELATRVGVLETGVHPIATGGTGATSASTALSNLGGAPLASPTFTGTVTTPALTTTSGLDLNTAKSGVVKVRTPDGASIATAGEVNTLQIHQNTLNADSFMTFHVAGDYAAHFGIDGTTNDLSYGGWSVGANKYRVYHAGNTVATANGGTGATTGAGLVPIIPSSVSVNAGTASVSADGWVTASGALTSISIEDCFPSSYRHVRMMLEIDTASGGADIWGRFKTASTTLSSGYNWWRFMGNTTNNSGVNNNYTGGDSSMMITRTSGAGGATGYTDFFSPNTGYVKRTVGQGVESGYFEGIANQNGSTSAYTGLNMFTTGVTLSTIRIKFYGYR